MVSFNPLKWFRSSVVSSPVVEDPNSDVLSPKVFGGQTASAPSQLSIFDGGKFAGGFGATQLQSIDYWTLRARSSQLFNENPYAKGIISRLVTNEINTGLTPEASPDEDIIGLPPQSLDEWTETVENRFGIWGKSPQVCDWKKESTFGDLQRTIRREALVAGDILIVLRQSQRTRLPAVQLISGGKVQTPLGTDLKIRKGNTISHGVELDKVGRKVAYWVRQDDGSTKRVPAFGEKSGRRISWLVYGTDKRLDDIRGQPLLAVVLQSLKEIDRYRDAAQRKAVINSILAMFIKKTQDKMGTLPVTGGAVRKDQATVSDGDGTTREFNIASQIPGLVLEELQTGEEPVGFSSQGTDINFGEFEEAIVQTIAWSLEIPPEILRLSFSNNYSASQAAINEFKIAINRTWGDFGEAVCTPVYTEWMISEVLLQKIEAPGLLDAWRDPSQYDVFGAWMATDWYGSIKPSTDMLKQAKGSKLLIEEGWTTNARESRVLTGTKFSKNMKRLIMENKLKAQAARPLLELRQEFGVNLTDSALGDIGAMDTEGDIEALLEEYLDENVRSVI